MAGVAIHGSTINESNKSGHVTYSIESWQVVQDGYCADRNEDGDCIDYREPVYGWVPAGSSSTGAKITGTVAVSSSKMKLTGVNVATVGDRTNETWVASPPIPSSNSSMKYTPTSAVSGSGQGTISSGSTKGKLQGKAIALIGSNVQTCLGTATTIKTGNEKMKFSS